MLDTSSEAFQDAVPDPHFAVLCKEGRCRDVEIPYLDRLVCKEHLMGSLEPLTEDNRYSRPDIAEVLAPSGSLKRQSNNSYNFGCGQCGTEFGPPTALFQKPRKGMCITFCHTIGMPHASCLCGLHSPVATSSENVRPKPRKESFSSS